MEVKAGATLEIAPARKLFHSGLHATLRRSCRRNPRRPLLPHFGAPRPAINAVEPMYVICFRGPSESFCRLPSSAQRGSQSGDWPTCNVATVPFTRIGVVVSNMVAAWCANNVSDKTSAVSTTAHPAMMSDFIEGAHSYGRIFETRLPWREVASAFRCAGVSSRTTLPKAEFSSLSSSVRLGEPLASAWSCVTCRLKSV